MSGIFSWVKSVLAGTKKRKQPDSEDDEDPILLSPFGGPRSSKRIKVDNIAETQPEKLEFGADPDPAQPSADGNDAVNSTNTLGPTPAEPSLYPFAEDLAPPKPQFDILDDAGANSPSDISPSGSLRHYISPLANKRNHAAPAPISPLGAPNESFTNRMSGHTGFGIGVFSPGLSMLSPTSRIAGSPYVQQKVSPRSPPTLAALQQVEDVIQYTEILDKYAPLPAEVLLKLQQDQYSQTSRSPKAALNFSTDDDDVVILAPSEVELARRSRVASMAASSARQRGYGVDIVDDEYEFEKEKREMEERIKAQKAALVAKYAGYVSAADFGIDEAEAEETALTAGEEQERYEYDEQMSYVSVKQSRIEQEVARKESVSLLRNRAANVRKEAEQAAQEHKAKLEEARRNAIRKNLSQRRRLSQITPEEIEKTEQSIRGPDPKIVLTNFNIDIKVEDLKRLMPGQWLNDEIINYYMELINERSKKLGAKVHCFSSIFYAFLSEKGFSYHRVQRWTRRIDVFAMDRVVMPIHLGSHWCLAVINFKEKKFEYYDSLGGTNDKCVERLRRWVQEESLDKKKVPFDLSDFTDVYSERSCPQQRNGFDCGVFTCKFGEARARDEPFDFSQDDMPYFRRRMWLEILNKQLHSDYE